MPQKTKIHWHLTWDGVECPRVRVTDERTWERYDHSGKLSLRPCSSAVRNADELHPGECERMVVRSGRILNPVTHDDRDTPYWRQQERWEILQRETASR